MGRRFSGNGGGLSRISGIDRPVDPDAIEWNAPQLVANLSSSEVVGSGIVIDGLKVTLGESPGPASTVSFAMTQSGPDGTAVTVPVTLRGIGELPNAIYGEITATKDGSVGQTYSVNSNWTNVQWYRQSLAAPFSETIIAGATNLSYTTIPADEGSRLMVRGRRLGRVSSAKAYQVVLAPPILLEGFESTSGWVGSAGASLSTVPDGTQGAYRLQVESTGTNSAKAVKADIGSIDPSQLGVVSVLVDLGQDAKHAMSGFRSYFTRSGTEYYAASITANNAALYQSNIGALKIGKYWSSYHIDETPTVKALPAGTLGLAVVNSTSTPSAMKVGYDALLARSGGRPTFIFGFDDLKVTQATVAAPMLEEVGIKASVHVCLNHIGADASRMSEEQLIWLHDELGWDMCLNGTVTDGAMTGLPDVSAILAGLNEAKAWCQARGLTRGNDFFCYPNGTFQASASRVNATSVVCNGTNVVTTSQAGIAIGQQMVGYNVPDNTFVTGVNGTSISLSNPVPTQTKQMAFINSYGQYHFMTIPTALSSAGYKMGRTTRNDGPMQTRFGFGDQAIVMHGHGVTGRTFESVKAIMDQTVKRGGATEFYIHGVLPTESGVDASVDMFRSIRDYAVSLRDAGIADILTKSEWWARDSGSQLPI